MNATDRRVSYALNLACRRSGLKWDPLFTRRRSMSIARARLIAMALLRQGFGMTTVEIGELFDRDHTSVIYACHRVAGFEEYVGLLAELVSAFPGETLREVSSTGKVVLIPRLSTDIRVTNTGDS